MSDQKIIAVVGATGAQGGALADAILADPAGSFRVRALTRDPDSDKARALAERGADVQGADIDDEVSLQKALEGAHGAFFVTFFWAHFSPQKELSQAASMARAAAASGVRHAIWSTLEDTRRWVPLTDDRMPTLMDHYKVPHFDAKGEANDLFTNEGVPTTFLHTSYYWENLIHFGAHPLRGPDGRLLFTLPMGTKKLPGIAVEDIGKCAYALFKAGDGVTGKRLGIAGEHLTGAGMAKSLSRVLGEEVVYNAVSPETYRSLDFPGADDLGNMFQFKHDFQEEFCGLRDVEASRKLNPDLLDFDGWLDKYGHLIPRS